MTAHSTTPTVRPADLPATIRAFLAAHAAREADTAIRTFSPDAVVTDEGRTFRGTEEVLDFLRHAGSQFTYTTELLSAHRVDDAHWDVVNRIEGDFPGNIADLTYRFTLTENLIAALAIG